MAPCYRSSDIRGHSSLLHLVAHMRILAIDEGSFSKHEGQSQALLLGCVVDNFRISKVMLTTVTVDGEDATNCVLKLARRCSRLELLLMGSISVAGFNVVDPYIVNRALAIPVIVVNNQRPRLSLVRQALRRHFTDWSDRLVPFRSMKFSPRLKLARGGSLYYCAVGLNGTSARSIIRKLTEIGSRPEPLRIARILARALSDAPFLQTSRRVR